MALNSERSGTVFFLGDRSIRLLFFGGKGGVGKTTSATAAALHAALNNPGNSFLLVSTDPAHSISDSIAGFTPPRNLEVLELDSEQCLADFKAAHSETLREIANRGTFLDDEDISMFLDLSLPGLDELMAFLEISRWVEDETYDLVIVDTAPSGHTLRLLSMPELIGKWLGVLDTLLAKHRYMKKKFQGFYRRDEIDDFILGLSGSVEQVNRLLQDSVRCRFVPVMIPEPLSIYETLALVEALEKSGIPVTEIIINRLYPDNSCPLCAVQRDSQVREINALPEKLKKYSLLGVHLFPEEIRNVGPLKLFYQGIFNIDLPMAVSMKKNGRGLTLKTPRVQNPIDVPSGEMKFLFFSGKGGVGKTTLASATAMELSRKFIGKEVLLFSTDPAHSLSACLEVEVGPEPKRIAPGLTALEIDAQSEFKTLKSEYAEELGRFLRAVSPNVDLTFDREVMERIMDLSPPGIDEVMALTRFVDLLIKGRYDLFVLDSAPTGHLIRLLELPEMIEQWLRVFFNLFLKYKRIFRLPRISRRMIQMSKEIKYLRTLLNDRSRSALYAVSIPTEMAFHETLDLVGSCQRMGVHVPVIFMNLLSPESDCGFCNGLNALESRVNRKFQEAFSDSHHSMVYRNVQPMGLERLGELGRLCLKNE